MILDIPFVEAKDYLKSARPNLFVCGWLLAPLVLHKGQELLVKLLCSCLFSIIVETSLFDTLFRYEDGNLPRMIPSDNDKPNEPMLQLHDMTDQYHKVSKGITATRLKLDALERYRKF